VVDKSATIHFKRPGLETLYAEFKITSDELNLLRNELRTKSKIDRVYLVELRDKTGRVHVTCEKTLHIRHKKG
jgi:hypothetical protein